MEYKGAKYIHLKKGKWGGKGSVIIYYKGDVGVVPGYPSIQRLVLLSKVPHYFPEGVSVEEKMNGYNVRVVKVGGEVFAVTRGGYLCPYTNARLKSVYGEELSSLLDELPPGSFVAGEVVGTENPYVRVEYPEAPKFDYFIFDIFVREGDGWRQMPVEERHELVRRHGLRGVRLLGTFRPDESVSKIKEIVDRFDAEGREGVVLKDPLYKRPPAKYTGSFTNIGDIEQGMKYPFDEGKDYLFPRIVREMFKVFEEGLAGRKLEERALWLGRAILAPAVEAVKAVAEGRPLHEDFVLRFPTEGDLEDYLDYVRQLGVKVTVLEKWEEGGWVVVKVRKFKRSPDVIESMLRTGRTPLD
ncbi:RNA ligase [Ignicoccus hospitalis]|uniref:ATP dependent DNA ligase n=1 Tax=Ignicoccus hospitalis (strain KIN4/I / DSM 18386 / JCM 14125) TaxID=453591 RepID=A8ABX5_IGNH4|nr:RNA ligase [Ignicoccus hospitalis]ABU82427.1 ATP dependent DNA ligase [Ignicoccus hospitalis KIN4/I]HIH90902.1 RNA ligase [Desulfurococcaceae archaeon]